MDNFRIGVAVVLLSIVGVSSRAAAQCTKDVDCRINRVCVNGACVESGQPAPQSPIVSPTVQPGYPTPQPGYPQSGYAQPGYPQPGYAQPGYPQSGYAQPGYPQPGYAQPGYPQPGYAQPGYSPHEGGWGRGGAIVGFVGAAMAIGFAAGAESTIGKHELGTTIALGSVALASLLVMAPISAAGGSSERSGTGATGLLGLRITGWILYGLTAADGAGLIAMGAAGVSIPHGPSIAAGVLGMASLIMFAADDLVSRSEAQAQSQQPMLPEHAGADLELRQSLMQRPTTPRLVVAPFLTPVRLADGATGGLLGVVGAF